ncbi:MAG TPA: TetR/AcrR family transcriptional regulator [Bacteroidetes bacterium]|nr:TetR/AcrR family transcriptional regulator [Bacteroidota bacterium]
MSPRTDKQWEEIRQKSKEKILDAATELFSENGFNATSINEIAKKAGISKGLVYNYFDSKYELLDEIIFSAFKEFDYFFEILSKNQGDPLELLGEVIEMTFKTLKEKPLFWKLITGLSFKQKIRERYAEQIAQREKLYFELASKLFQKLNVENPVKEFLFIGAIIDGMSFHFLEKPDIYPVEEMIDSFKEKIKKLYS